MCVCVCVCVGGGGGGVVEVKKTFCTGQNGYKGLKVTFILRLHIRRAVKCERTNSNCAINHVHSKYRK